MTNAKLKQPTDPYDTEAWMQFYAANPGFRRSVGAEGVNDGDDTVEGDGDDTIVGGGDGDDTVNGDGDDTVTGDNEAKPSDAEAKLLKDAMKHKKAAKEAREALAAFEGIDLDEYKELKAAKEKAAKDKVDAEQQRLVEKGEFESVKKQIIEAADEKLAAVKAESDEKDKKIQSLQSRIDDLTIGANFNSSSFLKEKTVLPPTKARKLYGDHFDIDETGAMIAYDKPRGSEGRAPLVDGSGDPLAFDKALAKIVDADVDRDDLLRTSLKPGSDSSPSTTKPPVRKKPLSAGEKIAEGIKQIGEIPVSTLDISGK